MKKNLLLLLLTIFSFSCTEDNITIPEFGNDSQLHELIPRGNDLLSKMEGMYFSSNNNDKIFIISQQQSITILTKENYRFFSLFACIVDSSIILEGYTNLPKFGSQPQLARFVIMKHEGARELVVGEMPGKLILRGAYGNTPATLTDSLIIRYDSPLDSNDRKFQILAHRGGGANGTCFEAPENSLAIINEVEKHGATGVEIDIQLTKDAVPIIFHDLTFSPRTINSNYLIGNVKNYDYQIIKKLGKYKNGETVATFNEMIDHIRDNTSLQTVWLDVKTPEVIPAIMDKVMSIKKGTGNIKRKIEIYLGLPSKEIYSYFMNNFLNLDSANRPDCLCELETSKVIKCGAKVWGPRWTIGTSENDIRMLHQYGIKTFFWTIDLPEIMDNVISKIHTESGADGFITDYPAIATYKVLAHEK